MTDTPEALANGAADGIQLPRRLAVFEAPDERMLEAALLRQSHGVPVAVRTDWEFVAPSDTGRRTVWHWSGSWEEFEREASTLLRRFIYPLVASGEPFVLGFPFERDRFRGIALDTQSLARLDLEDIGELLGEDVVAETYGLLSQLSGRLCLTPIEERLQDALVAAGIDAVPQARYGPYRLDFLIDRDGRQIGLEADGRGFHDPARDAARDADLVARGLEAVHRFTGTEIWRDASACADQVASHLRRPARRAAPGSTLLQALDSSQEAAVKHALGPARVLAPAGAGKTRVMVNRIINLVGGGVNPEQILVLTFNRKANEELSQRLRELHIPVSVGKITGGQGVVCATFNAFGYRYQREVLEVDFRTEPSESFWRRQVGMAVADAGIDIRGAARGSDPIGQFLKGLDRVRADLADPDHMEVEIERFGNAATEVVAFGPFWRTFQERRLATQVQAFDDQVFVAVRDLLENPSRRRELQRRFAHVLVDEFQDLNATQLALVDIVSRPQRSLFVVGDDDQLIYGWRYAELANILDFHDRYPVEPYSKTYVLSTNYRCSASVVRASRRVIDNNRRREPKAIEPRPQAPKGEVRYVASDDHSTRTDAVIDFLRERREAAGEWRRLAVLCRYKAQQPLIAMALDAAGIPRTPLLNYRLFSDTQMRLLRGYLQLVVEPQRLDRDQIALLINRPNRYIKNATVEWITSQPDPWEALQRAANSERAPWALVELRDRALIIAAQSESRDDSAVDLLDRVVAGFGLLDHWRDHAPNATGSKEEAGAEDLLSLVRLHALEVPPIGQFLAHWDSREIAEVDQDDVAPDDLERERAANEDRVVIGTFHSSKGREYDSVVLYDYDVDLSRLDDTQLEEERRVFYVGLTRAQTSLLATVDIGRGPAHLFLRESIQPTQDGEVEAIRGRLAEARADQARLVVQRREILQTIQAQRSGAMAAQLRRESATLETQIEHLQRQHADLARKVEAPGLLSRMLGRNDAARRALASLAEELSSAQGGRDALLGNLALLETDPDLAVAAEEDRLAPVEEGLRAIKVAVRDGASRIEEIALL
ncbi:MAG: UvrD-helicase domain-containing protein [Thermoleophilia bacterium]